MTGGRLAHICRHPIKGHGREDLASVRLLAGACLPWDRHWAVAHEAATLVAGWNPCVNFARGAKAPALMAITAVIFFGYVSLAWKVILEDYVPNVGTRGLLVLLLNVVFLVLAAAGSGVTVMVIPVTADAQPSGVTEVAPGVREIDA